MTQPARLWLIRHGETEWSRDGLHTSTTNLDLTDAGIDAALKLRDRLTVPAFDRVLCSPLLRAQRTADLAGFSHPTIDPDLIEWRYGDYEGRTTAEIQRTNPDWNLWYHGCPNGDSPEQIIARVDHLIFRLRALGGRTLIFAHGHILRSLAIRWLGQPLALGDHLPLDTAAVSILGYKRQTPTIDRWNA